MVKESKKNSVSESQKLPAVINRSTQQNGDPVLHSEAVVSSVIFYQRHKDKKMVTCPQGETFFRTAQARPLLALVRLAAEHLGFDIPALSCIDRAELLYRDDALIEVRASGKYVVGLDRRDKLVMRRWHTPVGPKFTMGPKLDFRLSLRDVKKSYIAILNKQSGAGVWWDFSAEYGREISTEGDNQQRFKFLVRREVPRTEAADLFPEAVDTTEVRERVTDLEADVLFRALIPHLPSDSRELLLIKFSEPNRTLIYLVDKSYVEYGLAAHHALKQGCNEELLAEMATARGLSQGQAKVLWTRNRLTEQAVFVRECVETVHEKKYQALRDMFDTILGRNIYEAVLADWIPLSSGGAQEADVIKMSLLRQEQIERKIQLGLRGRGRRRRTIEEREKVMAERAGSITRAMKTIRQTVKKDGAREDDIEDLITPSAVATELKISVSTLYRWLQDCALQFETVRDDVLTRPRSRR